MHTIISKINATLTKYLHHPGDSREIIILKKIWWIFNVSGLPFLLLMSGIIGSKEGFEVVIINYIWIISIFSGLAIFHFYKKGIQGYALVSQITIVLLASIKVYIMGGLLNAGGAIFIGLIGPMYALTLPNKKRAVFVFLLYMCLMYITTLLQDQSFTNYKLYYYILGFTLGITMAFMGLYYYTRQVERLKKEENHRMNELDEFKSKFYTHITHEFRTPLTIILGMVEQMKNNPKKWTVEGLKMIQRNGQKLLKLTNQMLDLSKLEANSMSVNLIQDDIAIYLKYLVESFHSLAGTKNIQLSFSADIEEINMDFDPDKIQEIMSNLLSNAIKFTPNGGHVRVSLSRDINAIDQPLILSIQDTGVGIPAEDLSKVFNRYFQANNHKDELTEGTGLGLALTQELVHLLKGEITLRSIPEEGTTFTVRLPITNLAQNRHIDLSKKLALTDIDSSKTDEKGKSTLDEVREKLVLLIVEDNKDVVIYLHSLLSNIYQIEVASNGLEGFKKATNIIPDLVISDVMMPVMDGYTFCEKVKADIRTSHIPVILLTARADVRSKMEGLKVGADVYLAKPFNKEELLVRIKKLIGLRKELQNRYKSLAALSSHIKPTSSHILHKEDTFMQKVRQILELHLCEEEFGIIELCHSVGMSRSQLYRKFSALTDTTVHHFIRKLRLMKAKELLLTTDLNVSEIAYDIGFKNPSHFSRIYSEEFGIAPSKTRALPD